MALAFDENVTDLPTQSHAARAADAPRGPDLLRFITCGSVDDGKSTLIGRLLYDSKSIFDDQLDALDKDSRRFGTQGANLDLALLVDGLSAEREQGITIDVAYRYFATPRRSFIVADTPGHEQYTRNMATGASTAELAIILIDARKGILPQTRRHSFIVSMLGVRHVVVAVNKMDLVDYDQATYDRICSVYRSMAADLGFAEIAYFPISARDGDNVAHVSPATPWRSGPSLLDYLETVQISESEGPGGLLFPVQWVNRPDPDFRGYAGVIARGGVRVGDDVLVLPRRLLSRVERIVTADGDLSEAVESQSVTLTLSDAIDVSRGDVIAPADSPLVPRRQFAARLLWTGETPLAPEESYFIKLETTLAQAQVTIEHAIDIHTFAPTPTRELSLNGIALTNLTIDRDVLALPYSETRDLGGFILIDKRTNETAAFGFVELDKQEATDRATITPSTSRRWVRAAAFFTGDAPGETTLSGLTAFFASVLASALLVLALTRSLSTAFIFALADSLLRPLVRSAYKKIENARARRSEEFNSDGAGI